MLTKIDKQTYIRVAQECIDEFVHQGSVAKRKIDGSYVTQADILISERMKELLLSVSNDTNFFSEEEEGSLCFPSFILDPIDGTRGFVGKTGEWVVSIAYFKSGKIDNPANAGILFNPSTNLWLESCATRVLEGSENSFLRGVVSRSDFSEAQLKELSRQDIKFEQKGSIALKLGLLSRGDYDFVYSKTNKNIWDIAAGTIICHHSGHGLYNKHGKLEKLESELIEGPLLWCRSYDFAHLRFLLES